MKGRLLVFLLSVSCLVGEGVIAVKTCGGQLGNQMFDVAATLAYAWDHDLTPLFPDFQSPENNQSFNKEQVFYRIETDQRDWVPLPLYTVANPGFVLLPPNLKNVQLDGGFFSWRYFDHHREKIVELFSPKAELVERLQLKYGPLLKSEKTVAIHVRSYSKAVHDSGLHFVGFTFFQEAMEKFPADSLFVVFSDRIQWAKANFLEKFPGKQFVFIEGNNYIEDFYLMSMMRHQILSRSSFSWWSAYLNRHQDKVIYYPLLKEGGWRGFFKPYGKLCLSLFGCSFWWDENYWLPDWNKIDYKVEPYPEDIYSYGDKSPSLYPLDK